MTTEGTHNEIKKEEVCKELPIRIINCEEKRSFTAEVVAPAGMRISHWDPIEITGIPKPTGEPTVPTGSIALTLKVQEGEQKQEKKSVQMGAVDMNLTGNIPATPATPAVIGQVTFGGQIKKELDDLFTNTREKHTLQLVADVAPIRNRFHMINDKVNLNAKLKVYFGPIPQLTNESQADTGEMKSHALISRATVRGWVGKFVSSMGVGRAVPPALGVATMAHQERLANKGIIHSPDVPPEGKIDNLEVSTLDINYASGSLSSKQGLFAFAAVGTVVTGVVLAKACVGEEEQLECVQDTLKNMCTLL